MASHTKLTKNLRATQSSKASIHQNKSRCIRM